LTASLTGPECVWAMLSWYACEAQSPRERPGPPVRSLSRTTTNLTAFFTRSRLRAWLPFSRTVPARRSASTRARRVVRSPPQARRSSRLSPRSLFANAKTEPARGRARGRRGARPGRGARGRLRAPCAVQRGTGGGWGASPSWSSSGSIDLQASANCSVGIESSPPSPRNSSASPWSSPADSPDILAARKTRMDCPDKLTRAGAGLVCSAGLPVHSRSKTCDLAGEQLARGCPSIATRKRQRSSGASGTESPDLVSIPRRLAIDSPAERPRAMISRSVGALLLLLVASPLLVRVSVGE